MTVKDLRAALAGLPDDVPVWQDDREYGPAPVTDVSIMGLATFPASGEPTLVPRAVADQHLSPPGPDGHQRYGMLAVVIK